MTENEYFDALRDLLNVALIDSCKPPGSAYIIQEDSQKPFFLNPNGLTSHISIKFSAISSWSCFRKDHDFAHKLCDRVIVAWDKKSSRPKYLLIELKSTNITKAHKQLGATLAFCHYLHRMVCVKHVSPPLPLFGSVTVWDCGVAIKATNPPKIPQWNTHGLQPDCKHMHYPRSFKSLPVSAVMNRFED